ncbi:MULTISPECIES: hypothetical protein [unclassified Arcicella]|uniref:hypothetical protein n=1 Tax=unclassified Arcicella TaxID=2644986 RepID=UPI00286511C5|nr:MULTISPECIES: hypothetical protein [unclassified Arcicella]MDR6561864.1 hypothetical protein [Arcicella sp. BE51]MDR6814010.1 hypothetical protein [Arcicella sp. BE140]MDR6825283.1 hypothetical protein [Arcicella sp. BE139]
MIKKLATNTFDIVMNEEEIESNVYRRRITSNIRLDSNPKEYKLEFLCEYSELWHIYSNPNNEFKIWDDSNEHLGYKESKKKSLKLSLIKNSKEDKSQGFTILVYFWGKIFSKENDNTFLIIPETSQFRSKYFKEIFINNREKGDIIKSGMHNIYKIIILLALCIEIGYFEEANSPYKKGTIYYFTEINFGGKCYEIYFNVLIKSKGLISIDHIIEI